MLKLRDARTGQLTDVLPAGRRQLRILVRAPGQVRAYLAADLLRRVAEISGLLPLVTSVLPTGPEETELRAACEALNIHPPRDTIPASGQGRGQGRDQGRDQGQGVPPFDVGIGQDEDRDEDPRMARLWTRVAGSADGIELGAEPLSVRLVLLRHGYGDPVDGGKVAGEAETAGKTLARWRHLVAQWAQSPSGAMSRQYADAVTGAFSSNLDTATALEALDALADDPDVPDGVKFETFAAADRLLALDLARDVGK